MLGGQVRVQVRVRDQAAHFGVVGLRRRELGQIGAAAERGHGQRIGHAHLRFQHVFHAMAPDELDGMRRAMHIDAGDVLGPQAMGGAQLQQGIDGAVRRTAAGVRLDTRESNRVELPQLFEHALRLRMRAAIGGEEAAPGRLENLRRPGHAGLGQVGGGDAGLGGLARVHALGHCAVLHESPDAAHVRAGDAQRLRRAPGI